MKIIYSEQGTPFGNICGGEVFKWDGQEYIKCSPLLDNNYNAVSLVNGNLYRFLDNLLVVYFPNTKLVIE